MDKRASQQEERSLREWTVTIVAEILVSAYDEPGARRDAADCGCSLYECCLAGGTVLEVTKIEPHGVATIMQKENSDAVPNED